MADKTSLEILRLLTKAINAKTTKTKQNVEKELRSIGANADADAVKRSIPQKKSGG